MRGHDHVANYGASVPMSHPSKLLLENIPRDGGVEQLHPLVTTESDEVEAALILIANRLHGVDCSSRPLRWMPNRQRIRQAAARIGNMLRRCRDIPPSRTNCGKGGATGPGNTVSKHSWSRLRAQNPSPFASFTSWFHTDLVTAAFFVHFIVDFHRLDAAD